MDRELNTSPENLASLRLTIELLEDPTIDVYLSWRVDKKATWRYCGSPSLENRLLLVEILREEITAIEEALA